MPDLDGNQTIDFYMIDPFDSVMRQLADPKYAGKQYTRFEAQCSSSGERAFDKANSGLVFQTFQLMDSTSSPVLALFFADASFAGCHMSHHPIYRK